MPLNLVLPNLKACDVGAFVGSFHQLFDGTVVGTVERIVGQSIGTSFDLSIVVDVLFKVEIVLIGVSGLGDKLTIHRPDDLLQGGLHSSEQIVCRVTTHVFNAGLIQAQRVPQFGSSRPNWNIDVPTRGEPSHR